MHGELSALKTGDIFVIALLDGRYAVGQVLGTDGPGVPVALLTRAVMRPEDAMSLDPSYDNAFSVLFTTSDLLRRRKWPIVGNRPVVVPRKKFPWEHTRKRGWIDAEVEGSAIVEEFANAYFGLVPWDDWYDPRYLDRLLTSPKKKPKELRFKSKSKRRSRMPTRPTQARRRSRRDPSSPR